MLKRILVPWIPVYFMLLALAALLLAGCGDDVLQQVGGLQVAYGPGAHPYTEEEVGRALSGWRMLYWDKKLDYRGLRVTLQEAPPCLAESQFYHQLGHQVRQREAGDADWAHNDYNYFPAPWATVGPRPAALTLLARVWYAQRFCEGYQ